MPSPERIPSPEEGAKMGSLPPPRVQSKRNEREEKKNISQSTFIAHPKMTPNPGTKPLHPQETLTATAGVLLQLHH